MAGAIGVDLEGLREVSKSLSSVRASVENVVDALPSIQRMAAEAWPGENEPGGLFRENCQRLRQRSVELMVSLEARRKMTDDILKAHVDAELKNEQTAQKLSLDSIFAGGN